MRVIKNLERFSIGLFVALLLGFAPSAARAQQADPGLAFSLRTNPGELKTIPNGTIIGQQNWTQYEDYMPWGMIQYLNGKHPLHPPPDWKIVVGPAIHSPFAKKWQEATEKYGGQAKEVTTSSGRHYLKGYVSGIPFPNPSGPNKGWQILANQWYHYVYRLQVLGAPNGTDEPAGGACTWDGSYHQSCNTYYFEQRRFLHLGDWNYPYQDPDAHGRLYIEYAEVLSPEQVKYTGSLEVWYDDPNKDQQDYAFVPALRRTLRLSTAARCAPSGSGSTTNNDDLRGGTGSGISIMDADFRREQPLLTFFHGDPKCLWSYPKPGPEGIPGFYYPSFFPNKPKCGKWEVRPVEVIDSHRIPSMAAGYCYSHRIYYVDKWSWAPIWSDHFDSGGHFWKGFWEAFYAAKLPGEPQPIIGGGSYIEPYADFQNNDWTSNISTEFINPPEGVPLYQKYMDSIRYGSPTGLNEIMK